MKLDLNSFGKKLKLSKRVKKVKVLTEKEMFVDLLSRIEECWIRSNSLYDKFKTKQIFKLDCLMLIASTVIIVIIANLSWIPLSWDRLLIPFLAPIAIVVGFTIESIIWMFSKLLD